MTTTTKLSYNGVMAKENQVITNNILNAEGIWKGKTVKSKETIENQMHRIMK